MIYHVGRTRIFYCNPRASYQTDIDLMINHINSFSRASLNWYAPIDVAKFTLDKAVIKKLNLKKISANEIQLTKKLLKKN